MIKAFLFDYDGVITPGVDVMLPAQRLAASTGITVDEAASLTMDVWNGSSTGKLSSDDAWNSIENQLRKKVPAKKRNIWHTWSELTPLSYMLELVKDLQARGYPVGLLSNVLPEVAVIIRDHGVYAHFDFTVLSCNVGVRKPDVKIYETAMKNLHGISANEVVFLDDREHCIQGAKDFGLQTILVTNQKDVVEEIYKLIGS